MLLGDVDQDPGHTQWLAALVTFGGRRSIQYGAYLAIGSHETLHPRPLDQPAVAKSRCHQGAVVGRQRGQPQLARWRRVGRQAQDGGHVLVPVELLIVDAPVPRRNPTSIRSQTEMLFRSFDSPELGATFGHIASDTNEVATCTGTVGYRRDVEIDVERGAIEAVVHETGADRHGSDQRITDPAAFVRVGRRAVQHRRGTTDQVLSGSSRRRGVGGIRVDDEWSTVRQIRVSYNQGDARTLDDRLPRKAIMGFNSLVLPVHQ